MKTNLLQRLEANGGRYTARYKSRSANANLYKRYVHNYAWKIAVSMFMVGFSLTLLLSAFVLFAFYHVRVTTAVSPKVYVIAAAVGLFFGGASGFVALARRMDWLMDIIEEEVERPISETVTMPTPGETAKTVRVNSTAGSRVEPKVRGGVTLLDDVGRSYELGGRRLDSLQKRPLTRDVQGMTGDDYNAMLRALVHNEYAEPVGRGYKLTEKGQRWLKRVGLAEIG